GLVWLQSPKPQTLMARPPDSKLKESAHFPFTVPIIAQITDYIYLGNLNAAYSGRALCTNGIDNIIDMSSLPRFRHNWSRLRVDTQAFLHGNRHEIRQPCFLVINECIEALMEKGKRVLIHCRDGYSLGPTCVIQYLMVKHSMRLLAAYELVRARYPLKIQECHQDLLVGLEMSLQPGGVNTACLKHSLCRHLWCHVGLVTA
uniref:protein-tyrosine-phosphatase n=1 Tax=Coturnix japonica TaxID=93934 RepID=A0A8C2U8A8_COTJA